MTEVILSFDTEDYTAPKSDEAILALSEILRSEGVRGCFNFVAELARTLVERKRRDILRSLASHEIDYHSFRHSFHPTIVEYCDTERWEEGWNRFVEEESKGIDIVRSVFGRDKLWAAVPPGNCIAAQAVYGYPALGIPIYSGSLFKATGGRGIWYCGALNLENNCYIDDLLLREGIGGVHRRLEEWKRFDRLIVCCHPNIIIYEEFWDRLNFDGANAAQWGKWRIPKERDAPAIRRFYSDFRTFVQILKADPDFAFSTYRPVWENQRGREPRTVSQEAVPGLLKELDTYFADPLALHARGSADRTGSCSLSQLFQAAVAILAGEAAYRSRQERGFLEEPRGIRAPAAISRAELVKMASALQSRSSTRAGSESDGVDWLPASIAGGGMAIGPRDFLEAARQILDGGERAHLAPRPQLPDMSRFHRFDDFRLKGTWMYPKDFMDRWVTKRLRLQSWTVRTEARTAPPR